jgi:hypothetical protein
MKNPLKENSHTGLYIGVGTAVLVAGVAAYLLFTEDGNQICDSVKEKTKDLFRDLAASFISEKTGIDEDKVRSAAQHVG